MFPYPSGAGLHVGHPLGYIASDIISRYKRLKGFNVLHPMGFDSFGLPAEQYAVQTGQHPAITTEENITRYKEQLDNIGFSFDWDREERTSDPSYYKWTQWIFIQLFKSWYNNDTDKAESIDNLIATFEKEGNTKVNATCDEETQNFSDEDWANFSEKEQQKMLLNYRLAFMSETMVNWCPELGTVLANDEVINGVSERGGFLVERKEMMQWSLRISAYAERLLQGLDGLDWNESLKEMQRNWIGKSKGCSLFFDVLNHNFQLEVFTTRIDTSFGVTYVTVAPEHELADTLTTPEQKEEVDDYVTTSKNRSERDRMSDVKTVSGVFTGSYAINPMNGKQIPIWIGDYVLASYGTGVVMAVPSSDERDYKFATHFKLPIVQVQYGPKTDISQDDFNAKAGTMINSDFLNGLTVPEAIEKAIEFVEKKGFGKAKINYRMRDAIFSRQRYWGEPIPIYFKDGIPYPIEASELPLTLPEIDDYKPTATGEPPLGRAKDWKYEKDGTQYPYELSTMPGWAGSSWYYFRYMDANNSEQFVNPDVQAYWKDVDLYLGGAEHATGHLLYSRFWNKFLFDLGLVNTDEAFKKLVNQGMIQGRSNFVYRIEGTTQFVSKALKKDYKTTKLHVDVNIVTNDILDTDKFKAWRPDFTDAEFILEDDKYHCGFEVEKMSKSKYNVVNPDDIIAQYGADTLRLYEMFLGPLEQFKPWNTNGIDGVLKFLKKLWRLFYNNDQFLVVDETPTKKEQKVIHGTIRKIGDIERLSLNTSVSNFMICVNELTALKCHKKEVLENFLLLLAPYAPHISEELWQTLGHTESITYASFPVFDESHLKEDAFDYPVMVNGKMRTKLPLSLDLSKDEIEKAAMANEIVHKWLDGNAPKKVIIVTKKIINIVV
jgi:leucyl-tRNA synthetase